MAASHLALEAVVADETRIIARCLLRRGRYVIGQEKRNEIITDAESISGRHARLTVASENQFFLEDLGSANGTFVDGRAIDVVTPVTLENRITLGHAMLRFERGGLPASVFQHLPENFLRRSRYLLEQVVVEGRTSAIYQALDTTLNRRVALKVLHRDAQARPSLVLAFIRENQIVAQLPHTHILPVYDFGLDEEIGLFSATRFVEGESLAGLLAEMSANGSEKPRPTLQALIGMLTKVCDAVAFAHERGVVHGRLHPDSIIFGRFGEVLVDRWGQAVILPPVDDARSPVEAPPNLVVSPPTRCMAPEQTAEAGIDTRADLYALGAILFRILTLRHFNEGETEAEILERARHPSSSVSDSLLASKGLDHLPGGVPPPRLAALCAHAMALDPEQRLASAHEFKLELVRWLEHGAGERGAGWKFSGLFGKH